MGFFNNQRVQENTKRETKTFTIGSGVTVNGDIKCEFNLNIAAKVTGNIEATETIRIAKNANIEGDITADKVGIEGHVKGTVKANIVTLEAGSTVTGNIITQKNIIKGALKGELKSEGLSDIQATASIDGGITTGSLNCHPKAILSGDTVIKVNPNLKLKNENDN